MENIDSKYHWGKFYWDAWLNDINLQCCDLAAQGLWINLIALMHKSEATGYLIIHGRPMDATDIAKRVGIRKDRTERLLKQLTENGVCSIASNGAYYCRRIVREENRRQKIASKKSSAPEMQKSKAQHAGMPKSSESQTPDFRTKTAPKLSENRKKNRGKPQIFKKFPLLQSTEIQSPESISISIDMPHYYSTIQKSDPHKTRLFSKGVQQMQTLGVPSHQIRPLLGNWLKALDGNAAELNKILDTTHAMHIANPIPFIQKCVSNRSHTSNLLKQINQDWGLPETPDAIDQESQRLTARALVNKDL